MLPFVVRNFTAATASAPAPDKLKSRMKYVVMATLSLAFAGWLVWSGSGADVAAALAALPAPALLLLVSGLAATYLLRALRVYHEFGEVTRGRFGDCLRLVLTHNALVNLLPMRAGELSFPLLLNRRFGLPLARAAGSLLWLRVQDAVILAALAVLCWPRLSPVLRAAGVAALATGGALLPPVAQWLLARVAPGRFDAARAALAESANHARIGWLWTLANWCVKLAVLSQVLALLFVSPLASPLEAGVAGAVGGELAAVLPVQGVAAIGSYEAGVAAALSVAGVVWSDGLKAAFSLHLLTLATALAAAGLALALPSSRANRSPPADGENRNSLPEP